MIPNKYNIPNSDFSFTEGCQYAGECPIEKDRTSCYCFNSNLKECIPRMIAEIKRLEAENAVLKLQKPIRLEGDAARSFALAAELSKVRQENDVLRAQPEQMENPLTLDELREMGGEPIWTETTGVEEYGRWELCTCEMVRACPLHLVLRCATAIGEVTDYEFDTYGKTWIAYRHRPEQEGV